MPEDETALDTMNTEFSQNIRQIEAAIDRALAVGRPEIERKFTELLASVAYHARKKFAIHNLIVADRVRDGSDESKARKERAQAALLINLFSQDRPHNLRDAFRDALARGPRWRGRIAASLARLPEMASTLHDLS